MVVFPQDTSVAISAIRQLVKNNKDGYSEDLILSLPPQWMDSWEVGGRYETNDIVERYNIKYKILQNVVGFAGYEPELYNTREFYKPYQGFWLCNWAYGEDIKIGMQRHYEGIWYIAEDDNENDIITPDKNPIWKRDLTLSPIVEEVAGGA